MTELSFYARGDSSTANNAALNVKGTSTTPTTLLTFSSGESGDVQLDYNDGLADPDTLLIIDGVAMSFTVEFSGNLPYSNKLSNVNGEDLRGEQIVVITAESGQRFVFLSNGTTSFATMSAFPNGAHAIDGVSSTGPILVCFLRGTRMATPEGERAIETLRVGDLVLNDEGEAVPLRWIGRRSVSATEVALFPDLRPVIVPKDMFGPGLPNQPLGLSPQHRVALRGWEVDLLFGCDKVLVPAIHLPKSAAMRATGSGPFEYFHLLFDQHEIVFSNGLPTESFQLGERGLISLEPAEVEAILAAAARHAGGAVPLRPDHCTTLRGFESQVLMSRVLAAA